MILLEGNQTPMTSEEDKDKIIQELVNSVKFGRLCDDDLRELALKSYAQGIKNYKSKVREAIRKLKKDVIYSDRGFEVLEELEKRLGFNQPRNEVKKRV